jgi:hypothetical protein
MKGKVRVRAIEKDSSWPGYPSSQAASGSRRRDRLAARPLSCFNLIAHAAAGALFGCCDPCRVILIVFEFSTGAIRQVLVADTV